MLHINRPFEVCLLSVLLLPLKWKTTEKVDGEQGLNFSTHHWNVLDTSAGQLKPQNDERYYW
jgi:hypothetical protein